MKSIKTLLFALLIILAGNVAAQKEYVIKAAGMNIINVTNVAEAYLTDNSASIGGYTGLNFDLTAELELWATTIQVRDSLGFDVFTAELPYISSNAEGGLESNIQLAMNSITSDRYIFIGFTISNNPSEEVGRFFTRIVEGEPESRPDDDEGPVKSGEGSELSFEEEYVNGVIQEWFNSDGGVKVPRAETEGLRALLGIMLDNNAAFQVYEDSQRSPAITITRNMTFLSLSGLPVSLPKGSKVEFYHNDDEKAGLLLGFKLPKTSPNGNVLRRYFPVSYISLVPEVIAGFVRLKDPENGLTADNVDFYSHQRFKDITNSTEKPPKKDETITVYLGLFYGDCGTTGLSDENSDYFYFQKRLYTIPWDDLSREDGETTEPGFPKDRGENLTRTFSQIEPHFAAETSGAVWNSDLAAVVSIDDSQIPLITNLLYPCFRQTITEMSLAELESGLTYDVIAFENGTNGVLRIFNGKIYFTYTTDGVEYYTMEYDEFYGWKLTTLESDLYASDLYQLLFDGAKWTAEFGVWSSWIGLNIYVGNEVEAAKGLLVAFSVDLGFAAGEGALVYYDTGGDQEAAFNTFLIAVAGAAGGFTLGNAMKCYTEYGAKTYIRVISEASPDAPRSFFKLDLKKYAEKCRTFLNFSRAKVKKMFEEMGNNIKLLRYLGRNYKRVKSWKVLFDDDALRVVTGNLEKVDNHLAKGIHFEDEMEAAFKAATDKAKWVDDIGYNVLRKANNKAEYINPTNNLLKWTDQHPNSINQSIQSALNSPPSGGKFYEGKVADYMQQQGKTIDGFGLKVNNSTSGNIAGDIDVMDANNIIEVKKSYSSFSEGQVDKFVDTSLPNYLNPYGKNALLYIDEAMTATQKADVLSKIPSNVTLVNSLNELGQALQ